MAWTAYLRDNRELRIEEAELRRYAEVYVGQSELASRISLLFWMDAFVIDKEFGVGPHEILASVKSLEAGETSIGVKPATQFRNPPLRGLWHKHFFAAQFLAKNIELAHGKNGLKKLVEEVFHPSKPVITREMIDELAHRFAHEALEKRGDDDKLTGEWIIYVEHDGKKHYLCINTHEAGDQMIYDRIIQLATKDFPDVAAWIQAEADAMTTARR